ncbi:MAG: DegV family EDD domain-containing protein [Actinomycetia bacterium]|nr:DegV family EDD domain-containing protein [Actinomycetes bacterium]
MTRVVVDSGWDMDSAARDRLQDVDLQIVPLTLCLDGQDLLDDDSLDLQDFLRQVEASASGPSTAAPSPQLYLDAYGQADEVYTVTLSSKLSGSFDSACLAARLWAQRLPGALAQVFDSLSASVGESLVVLQIAELLRQRLPRPELIGNVQRYIKDLNVFIILDSYDTLIKTGRVSRVVGTMAELLRIKCICAGIDGEIKLVGKARNYAKALKELIRMMQGKIDDFSNKILAISHCEAAEKALATQRAILDVLPFKDSFITTTGGLCTTYASRGGIVVAF